MPAGRPSIYSDELAERIFEEMVEGRDLVDICKDDDMPGRTTVYRWMDEYPNFGARYARAREGLTETRLKRIREKLEAGDIETDRLRIMVGHEQWVAEKIAPRFYGAKTQTEISGPNGKPIQVQGQRIDLSQLDDEQLEQLQQTLRLALKGPGG